MKVTDMTNLWVGYNETEDFRVLICAPDKQDAQDVADEYRFYSHLNGDFEISEFNDTNTHFDCNYVLS